MKSFNINNSVLVQITDIGWKYLRESEDEEYIEHCIMPYKTIIDGEEWYKFSLWGALDILPPRFGKEPYFKTTILIED